MWEMVKYIIELITIWLLLLVVAAFGFILCLKVVMLIIGTGG